MGNRVGRLGRRPAVEERLTRPRRLARRPPGVDYGRLRRLILAGRLAPCFDALDDGEGLEDCPICFLYYPTLNRSVCCGKGICTECFIQMKSFNTIHTIRCPYCKTSSYAVEYRGARTEEEIGLEQVEEQKVIEAKIKMWLKSENVDRPVPLDQTCSVLEAQHSSADLEGHSSGTKDERDIEDWRASPISESFKSDPSSIPNTCIARHEEFDSSLEEIMLMEAIWESLQDFKLHNHNIHQTFGSYGMVGPQSRTHGEYSSGEFSLSNSLSHDALIINESVTQQNISWQKLSKSSYCRSQTSLELHRDLIEESNATCSGATTSWHQGVEIECNLIEGFATRTYS